MIKEHDCVVLTEDIAEKSLEVGDVGTVVHVHAGGTAYEVEFVTFTGQTVGVVTLASKQVRSIAPGDLSHVRPFNEPTAASVHEKSPKKYGL